MKKLMIILLTVCLMVSYAAAEEIDLSGMTFDQLVALKNKINLAIWNSHEWQEVTVPQGVWIVGEDIPAGKWTIRCADLGRNDYLLKCTNIKWGAEYDPVTGSIPWSKQYGDKEIYNPNSSDFKAGRVTEITVDLKDGYVVIIHDLYNKAVFSPFTGKPDLGFK